MRDDERGAGVLAEANEEMLFCDGLDEALIGVVRWFGHNPVALYSREKCIEIFMRDGMSVDDAEEYFEYNVIGAYVGENTPAFAFVFEKEGTAMTGGETHFDRDVCANRHGGADTSVAAHDKTTDQTRARQRAAILRFIQEKGEAGATADEIEATLEMPHQSCSARISELHPAGMIHYTNERRLTRMRRPARVYFFGPAPEPKQEELF